jgi:hypothetical protein
MANPYFIESANPLQALMMGQQGYKTGKEFATESRRTNALSQLMGAGGAPDYASVAKTLAASGDLAGATQIAGLNKALAGPEQTDEIKEYNLSKAQGYKGSFTDWKTALKQAGATRVNTNVHSGEKEYDKVLNKAEAERFIGYQKGGQNAQSAIGSLDVLEGAMKDPNFYSGVGAERFALPLRQAQASFGGDPKAAASMETFRSTASKAALDAMGGSLGSGFSNADRDFVLNQVPNLANTPEGNKSLIDVSRKVRSREIEIAKMARDYAAKNGGRIDAGFDAALADYAEKNPLFKAKPPSAQNAPQVREGTTATNPSSGQKIMFRGGRWVPMQ